MTQNDDLDALFSALASETRRAILARLAQGEASVNDLAAPFDMSLPAISKHVAVLEKAGLITRGRKAQSRPCRLAPGRIAAVSTWAEAYRPIWEGRFDKIEFILNDMEGKLDDE